MHDTAASDHQVARDGIRVFDAPHRCAVLRAAEIPEHVHHGLGARSPSGSAENSMRLDVRLARAAVAVALREVWGEELRWMDTQRSRRDVGESRLSCVLVEAEEQQPDSDRALAPPGPPLLASRPDRPDECVTGELSLIHEPFGTTPPGSLGGRIAGPACIL